MNFYSLLYLDVMNATNERNCLKLRRGPRGPDKLLFLRFIELINRGLFFSWEK